MIVEGSRALAGRGLHWLHRRVGRCLDRAACSVAALIACGAAASADPVADFYRGKTVTIQVGYGPGGGYDLTTRLIARFIGNHIPGKPTVVVQNVPGAGSMRVTNALYNSTPNDGLTLGVFAFDVLLEPFYGEKRAMFEPAKFAWVGSMDTDIQFCGIWKGAGAGINSLPDLLAAKKTVSFGASAPGTVPSMYPMFLKKALGAPIKIINGYTGTKEIIIAMERGEVDAACGLFESVLRTAYASQIESGNLRAIMQSSLDKRSATFPEAMPVMDVVKTDELRGLARLVFSPAAITRPLAAPPGTPQDRLTALRSALVETTRDPAAIAAAKTSMMRLESKSHTEVEAVIAEFAAARPEMLAQVYALTHE